MIYESSTNENTRANAHVAESQQQGATGEEKELLPMLLMQPRDKPLWYLHLCRMGYEQPEQHSPHQVHMVYCATVSEISAALLSHLVAQHTTVGQIALLHMHNITYYYSPHSRIVRWRNIFITWSHCFSNNLFQWREKHKIIDFKKNHKRPGLQWRDVNPRVPGRRRAGSIMSGRFVAAITATPLVDFNPASVAK